MTFPRNVDETFLEKFACKILSSEVNRRKWNVQSRHATSTKCLIAAIGVGTNKILRKATPDIFTSEDDSAA